jgi:hypothetical protein
MAYTPSYTSSSDQGAGEIKRQLISDYGILHREVYPKYIEKYGSQNFVLDMEIMGKKSETPNRDFYHWRSKGRLHQAIQIAANVADPGAGNAVQLTLAAAYHTQGGTASPLRVGEVLEINASAIQGQIISVDKSVNSAHKFTIVPIDILADFHPTTTDELLLRGNIYAGEASDKMDTLNIDIEKITGSTTEIREDFATTDRALLEELEIEIDGGKGYKYLAMDVVNRRFHNQEDWALVFGQKVTNGVITSGSVGTQGLMKTIDTGGQKVSYATGSFGLSVFDDITRATDIAGGASEYLWLCDTNQRIDINNAFFNSPALQGGGVVYGSFSGDSELALKMGYKSYDVNGQSFHFKKYDALNSTSVYGVAPGYYNNTGWLIPMDKGVDAKTQEQVDSLSVRFHNVDGSGEVLMAENGLLSKKRNGTKAELQLTMLAYKGLQVFNEQRFIKVYAA